MPRRNQAARRTRRPRVQIAPEAPDLTLEQVARELVRTGVCSPGVLDRPMLKRPETAR